MKKRILCLIILMLTVSAVQVFAQGDLLVTKEEYRENVVLGLGLVDGKLKDKETISRAEFAVTLSALINEPAKATGKTSYQDVKAGTKECGAIENLRTKGIMIGVGENSFAPDKPIMCSQAISLILKATGNIVEFNGNEIVSNGNYNKLAKGTMGAIDSEVSYETLVNLVFKALDITVMPFDGTVSTNSVSADNSDVKTLPEKYFNYKRINGVLETDSFSSIKETDVVFGSITIAGKKFKSDIDYNEYIGYSVDCFVDEETNEVIFLTADDENRVTVIDEVDINNYDNREYKYSIDGKEKRISFDYETDVAYNDRVMMTYDAAKMQPKNGYVVLIDNNDDKDIDVVRIIDYVNVYVSGVSTEGNETKAYDQVTGKTAVMLSSENADRTAVFGSDGNDKKIAEIKTGAILSIIGDVSGSQIKARRVIVSTEKVMGSANAINGADGIIEINGEEYYISDSLGSYSVRLNQEYTFLVDYRGRIAAITGLDRSEIPTAIGYVIKAGIDENDKCYVRILTSYNKVITYTCAQKVWVEDVGTIKKQDIMRNLFQTNIPVVGYAVNEEKEINRVKFATDYSAAGPNAVPQEFGIYKIFNGKSNEIRYYPYFKSFWGSLNVKDSTVMFVIPEDTTNAELTDYKVEPISRLNDDHYKIDGYVFDNQSMYCDVAVAYAYINPEVSSDSNISVVKKILSTIDEDDCPVDEVTLIGKSGEVTLRTKDSNVLKTAERYNDSSVTDMKIAVGDAVMYTTDSDDRITKFVLVYDNDDNKLYSSDGVGDGNQESLNRRIMEANVYSVDSDYVHLMAPTEHGSTVKWDKIESIPMERVAIVVVEDEKTVRAGSIADIESYKNNGKSSKVVMNSRAFIGYVLVVFK